MTGQPRIWPSLWGILGDTPNLWMSCPIAKSYPEKRKQILQELQSQYPYQLVQKSIIGFLHISPINLKKDGGWLARASRGIYNKWEHTKFIAFVHPIDLFELSVGMSCHGSCWWISKFDFGQIKKLQQMEYLKKTRKPQQLNNSICKFCEFNYFQKHPKTWVFPKIMVPPKHPF